MNNNERLKYKQVLTIYCKVTNTNGATGCNFTCTPLEQLIDKCSNKWLYRN